MRRILSCVALVLAFAGTVNAAEAPQATEQAHRLFDDYWSWLKRALPDFATLYFGETRNADRLRDQSPAAVTHRNEALAAFRLRAAGIDVDGLSAQDRVSLRVLRFRLESAVAINEFHGALPFSVFDEFAPLTQLDGFHLMLPELARASRFAAASDYEAWLKRLEAVPASVAHLIERMQLAIDSGWMPPKAAIARVPQQLLSLANPDPTESPVYRPFKTFSRDIDEVQQRRLQQAAHRIIREQVAPAFQSLKVFYETRYLPAATEGGGLSRLPSGLPYYQAWLRWFTTTDLTPREIHDLGLAEVARIGAQMDAIVADAGFKGTRADFQSFITSDDQFFYTRPEDMLAAYRDMAKRADAELPKLFAELPRQPYGIRAMPVEMGDNTEYYTPGAADRPGWFEANVNNLRRRPKWSMEWLLLHEAVPGHHLQTARAREQKDVPAFRRFLWFPAFGEGWALYAESLGYEMGFYADPYQRFGNLSAEMKRASRLVVDTGLHAFGWGRQQAIDYLAENAALTAAEATAEVDRYLVSPGQATAYKIGEIRIKALRTKAKAALGDRFDLRKFHNAVIDNGGLPLLVLDEQIDEWIATQRSAP